MHAHEVTESQRRQRRIAFTSIVAAGVLVAVKLTAGVQSGSLGLLAEALHSGGVRLLEVTLNTEGALKILSSWRENFPLLCIGAGTVVTLEDARSALSAGAQFLVTPNLNEDVVTYVLERGLAVFPGALTPTEIVRAHALGASAVKVFPVGALGGPSYIKEVRAPLNHIPLIAVGGVNVGNARAYLEAGCVGLGVGSSLLDLEKVRRGDFEGVRQNAENLVRALEGG